MNLRTSLSLLLILPLLILLQSCGSTDRVTVVDRTPENATERTDRDAATQPQDEFMQLRAGLLEPVTNLDPLFADNLSTLRVISLIYDGLFELNEEGEPEPKLVQNFEISDDGTEYLLTINRDLYFHDSNVFSAGVGRRIHADDVKWAFERTARIDVPGTAAQLLMNIRGFETYFLEQRNIYDADKRVLTGVSGIEVVNAETIRITLSKADDLFLQKLASPYLSIYPREAVTGSGQGLKNQPVGTGPYILNSKSENSIILARNPSPRFTDSVSNYPINRIDFSIMTGESEIFQQFARKNLDWIPELGPRIQRQVVGQSGGLTSSYSGQFQLIENSAQRLTHIYLNENSDQNLNSFKNRLNRLEADQISLNGALQIEDLPVAEEENEGSAAENYYIVFTDNPYARLIFNEINTKLFSGESSLTFVDIRIPTPETILYSLSTDSIHDQLKAPSRANLWMTGTTSIFSLHHNHVEGIRPSTVPWGMHLQNVRVTDSEWGDS